MNVLRLGFHWHMIERTPGQYNMTYINILIDFVDRLNKHNVHVILDMHQDCWSPLYCGAHGLPAAYSHGYSSDYDAHGSKAYPIPLLTPQYAPNGGMSNCDDVDKKVFGWASCYATYAIGAASQRLYDNDKGVLDRFGDFWKLIANKVKDFPNVIGYELLNEPWLGDAPLSFEEFIPTNHHWDLWFPTIADKNNLQKMYIELHNQIRTVDNTSVIFFEPATGGNFLDAFPVGFTQGPGGPEYNDRQALAYHVYCPFIDSKNASSFIQHIIAELTTDACDLLNDAMYDVRHHDTKKLGHAGFLTEFGNNGLGITPEILNFATKKMDEFMHGWTYWYLAPDTNMRNSTEIEALARPYPQKIAGTPTSYSYDPAKRVFVLEYMPCTEIPCVNKPTEIFTSKNYAFSSGMTYKVDTDNQVTENYDPTSQILYIHTLKVVAGTPIRVTITPQ